MAVHLFIVVFESNVKHLMKVIFVRVLQISVLVKFFAGKQNSKNNLLILFFISM